MRVCISTFVNVVVLYRIRSGQSQNGIYDTRDRDKPYKDSAQLKSRGDDLWLRNFPSTLDVIFFAPSAVADLGARDLLVRVTRN